MSIEPMCTGCNCPLKHSCGHYSEVIHEDDVAFTHAPYQHKAKKCEHYFGMDAQALVDRVKDILNGKDSKQ